MLLLKKNVEYFLPNTYCVIKYIYVLVFSIVFESDFLDTLRLICHIDFSHLFLQVKETTSKILLPL